MATIDVKAFIDLENSLSDRLLAAWSEVATPLLDEVSDYVEAGDYASAVLLAEAIDLSPIVEQERDYIRYMAYAALMFGASRITEDTTKINFSKSNIPEWVDKAVLSLSKVIEYNVEDLIRDRILEYIAGETLADPTTNFSASDFVFKYDPNQPREPAGSDKGGQWAGEGDFSSLKNMPSSIEGVPIEKRSMRGNVLAIGGTSGILVNSSRRVSSIWKDLSAYQKRAFESGWMASAHPNHTLWHELGHVKQKNESPEKDFYLGNLNPNFDSHFKNMASQVSRYAGTNGKEFIAEVFAARKAGREFTPELIKYYEFLGGPKL